ncbi:YdeI/OmpD-associated family protein [Solitalea sp. MAHUQ-68]|uniref:YdeI/OmpD-associated family protein n=1 Tax=Solitalea agri TaxID=2953739 RepID=A0A9X2F408_9SPHI|nr:DUF1801 domain-containing protein [Solitalea agri]MCO4294327.1 YdeI/OmpD-associated family protein [Solitalea agri]
MKKTDPRIDAYIQKSAPFAQPILNHLRELMHIACNDIEETMKWSMPYFDFKGVICGMAAFKNHCALVFWKASLMKDPSGLFVDRKEAMGHLGRISSLSDLPPDEVLIAYIQEAVQLNIDGVKLSAKEKNIAPKVLIIPDYLIQKLDEYPQALQTFQDFNYSHKKEYVEWITEAKTENTRLKRLDEMIALLLEGMPYNWKYMK